MDIFLVVCYFIIVKGAETLYPKKPEDPPIGPNGYNQTLWSMIIFSAYLLWDILTKLFDRRFKKIDSTNFKRKVAIDATQFWQRSWQTLLCLLTAITIFILMQHEASKWQIVCVDLLLGSLFLLFRGLKEKKAPLEVREEGDLFPSDAAKLRAGGAIYPLKIHPIKSRKYLLIITPIILILLSVIAYYILPC
jgi:hypothetical protein